MKEQHLYGSSRLGIWKPNIGMYQASDTYWSTLAWKKAGLKQYELTNHLGNVLATISDKRTLTSNGQYLPDVVTAQDYYTGGMPMPGRSYQQNATKTRFGFNGMENDNEVAGNGNHLSFGDYGYSPRIVRRWNLDPMEYQAPGITPYQFGFNNPINFADPDGTWPEPPTWGSIKKSYNIAKTSIARNYNDAKKSITQTRDNVVRTTQQTWNTGQKWVKTNRKELLKAANTLEETGETATNTGLALAAAGAVGGVTATPGLTLAVAGGVTSGIGVGLKVLTNVISGDVGTGAGDAANYVAGEFACKLADVAIPGPNPSLKPQIQEVIKVGREVLQNTASEKTKEVGNKLKNK